MRPLSTPQKVGLGITAAAAVYLGYRLLTKNKANKQPQLPPGYSAPAAGGAAPPETIIAAANQAPVNSVTVLSPKGTPDNQLDYQVTLKLGDKGGEIEKLQKIINAISLIYGTKKIGVDGTFGSKETLPKVKAIFGKESISLGNAYKYYQAVAAWQKAGKKGKVTDYLPGGSAGSSSQGGSSLPGMIPIPTPGGFIWI